MVKPRRREMGKGNKEKETRADFIRRRFSEAETPEDVKRIRGELLEEDIPQSTVDTIKGEMLKKGQLPKGATETGMATLQRAFPQRLGRYDVLTPEGVLEQLRLQDGEYKVGFTDGIAMLLLAARLNQELAATQAQQMEPMIKMLSAMRQEEKDAAERARGSTMDVAREAAEGAAARVVGYLDQKKPDIASTPDPVKGFVARAMETMWDRITGTVLGGAQTGQAQLPPGWADKRQQGGQS
jgi:hypothetical protein